MYTAHRSERRSDARGSSAAAGEPASLGDGAYRALKARLLRGEFPANVRLGEVRLAGELGVSRTPVREAMGRLHTEGLLERHPEGGYRPWVPEVDVMRDLYEVRAWLELQGLLRPGRSATAHDRSILEALRDRWKALEAAPPAPDPDFVLLDEDFHVTLLRSAGNAIAVEHLCQVNDRIRVVRMLDFLSEDRIAATIAEHLELCERVLSGDLVSAEAAFAAHLAASMAVVEERVAIVVTRLVRGGRP
jgi:DNA-binding GntR family transcriptional regulator